MSGDKSGQAPNEHRTSGEIGCNQGNGNNGGFRGKDFFSKLSIPTKWIVGPLRRASQSKNIDVNMIFMYRYSFFLLFSAQIGLMNTQVSSSGAIDTICNLVPETGTCEPTNQCGLNGESYYWCWTINGSSDGFAYCNCG